MLRSNRVPAWWLAVGFLAMCFLGIPAAADEKAENSESAEARIRRVLDERTSLAVEEAPLGEVVKHLREKTNINILLDRKALDEVGLADDTPLNGTFRDISLRSILNLLLKPYDLTWSIDDGALVITTPEVVESRPITRVYNVKDLADGISDTGEYLFESVITTITSTIRPETWEDVGGPSPIDQYRGTIIISQTEAIHREIAALLEALRKGKKMTAANAEGPPPQVSIPLTGEVEESIRNALKNLVSFELPETPLSELPAVLKEKLGVQATIDRKALEDVGLAADAAVSLSVAEVQGDQALSRMLQPLDLTWMIRDEVVVITTKETVEATLEPRVYPVRDLYEPGAKHDDELISDQHAGRPIELMTVIGSSVQAETWDDVGGAGAMEFLPIADVLVISQTSPIHAQVEDFLTQLRQRLAEKPEVPPLAEEEVDADALKLVVYTLPVPQPVLPPAPAQPGSENASPVGHLDASKTADTLAQFGGGGGGGFGGIGGAAVMNSTPPIPGDDLVEIIVALVEPESWNREGVYIKAVPGRLIVRQNTATHRKVQTMLRELGLNMPSSGIGYGGTSGGGFF